MPASARFGDQTPVWRRAVTTPADRRPIRVERATRRHSFLLPVAISRNSSPVYHLFVPKWRMACPRRVLLIGLDGFDAVLAQHFAEEGLLPNFARLQNQGASFKLDHGRDKYSGLAWEHLSSGIRPRDGGRWSAVTFNKRTYQATQDHTVVRPFLADLSGIRS